MQVIVVTLTGCATLEDKMQQLQCHAPVDSSMCTGWQT